jgi:hypothetical protein
MSWIQNVEAFRHATALLRKLNLQSKKSFVSDLRSRNNFRFKKLEMSTCCPIPLIPHAKESRSVTGRTNGISTDL